MIRLLKSSRNIQRRKILVTSVIVLIVLFSAGTIMLRGKVDPETYKTIQGINEIEGISTFSISKNIQAEGFFEDFKNNFAL